MEKINKEYKNLYVYIDETGSPNLKHCDKFCLGALISESEINNCIIDKTMKDIEISDSTDRAVSRNYFHASKDTSLTRITFAENIKNIVSKSEFYVFDINIKNKEKTAEKIIKELPTEKNVHHQIIHHIISSFLIKDYYSIKFYLSARGKTLRVNDRDNIIRTIHQYISYFVVDTYSIPMYVPEFEIHITEDQLPGLQVTDYLLWEHQRNGKEGLKKVNYEFYASMAGEEYPFAFQLFYKDKILKKGDQLTTFKIPSHQSNIDKFSMLNNMLSAYRDIYSLFHLIFKNRDKIRNSIVQIRINTVLSFIGNQYLSDNEIIEMHLVFLIVCDEIPLYNQDDTATIEHIYFLKYAASIISNRNLAMGSRIRLNWNDIVKYSTYNNF